MGNWTTVNITGTCSKEDLPALKYAINTGNDWDKFHCLCNTGGLCGLNDWAGESIDVQGNLAERDYDNEDIAEQLRKLIEVAPSLDLEVHVGGDYESTECVATINCRNRNVTIDDPEVKVLSDISEDQIRENLMRAIQ